MQDDTETTRRLERFLAGIERRALRIAELATHSRDEALDIVQDAMLKLVQRYAQRDEQEWPPLFHRILQNRINDWHRRHKAGSRWLIWWSDWRATDEGHDAAEPEFAVPAHQEPLEVLAREGVMETLISALRDLPLRQQQAFLLRVWEGFDVAQTAFAMRCSEGSVKTHLSRAMARLRQQLEIHR